jgi:hypothetical protein
VIGGTFLDSKISKARKDYECGGTGHFIKKGDMYLRYRWGMYDSSTVCLHCATTIRRDSGSLYYNCAAVESLLGTNALAD